MSDHLSLLQQQREIIREYHSTVTSYDQAISAASEELKHDLDATHLANTSAQAKADEVTAKIITSANAAAKFNIKVDTDLAEEVTIDSSSYRDLPNKNRSTEAEMENAASQLSSALVDFKSVLLQRAIIYTVLGVFLISGIATLVNNSPQKQLYYSVYYGKFYESPEKVFEDLFTEGTNLSRNLIAILIIIIAVTVLIFSLLVVITLIKRISLKSFVWFVLYGLIIVGVNIFLILQTTNEANKFITDSSNNNPIASSYPYAGYVNLYSHMTSTSTDPYLYAVTNTLSNYYNIIILPARDLSIGLVVVILLLDFIRSGVRKNQKAQENFTKKLFQARLSLTFFVDEMRAIHNQNRENAHFKHKSTRQALDNSYQLQLGQIKEKANQYSRSVQAMAPDWNTKILPSGNPYVTVVGKLNLPRMTHENIPIILSIIGGRSVFLNLNMEGRSQVTKNVQSILLQLLMSISPGKLQFTFIDPVGLGQNVAALMHLTDYDEALVTGKAWTQQQHIEQRLNDLTDHMENVIQKYLRNEYHSIEDYNTQAGEVAEPYRIVVVFDFPVNFSDITARRLLSIVENGPRCGVYAIVVANTKQSMPYGFEVAQLEQACTTIENGENGVVWRDSDIERYSFELTTPPDDKVVNNIVHAVGEKAKDANKVEVPFERIIPFEQNWWERDSQGGLIVALGPSGARKIQQLELGKGTAHHVLVAGKTGSGKSNLLHTIIMGLSLNYSPDDIELYLIDFKKGVEFKAYASYLLPHARVVAIESEREFGLSVLQGLDNELKRRGDLFRNIGVDNLGNYRQKSDQKMPRILLLVDEFQEFFTEDDSIASQTSQILDRLVRQGRSFGIHVLLGSQTLAGAYTLAKSTMEQMAVRIALQCSEADSRLILADDNPAARLLTRPGEAIYNATNGMVEGNNRFQTAFLPDEQRDYYLSQVRDRAQKVGYKRIPIIFEGNTLAEIHNNQLLLNLLSSSLPISFSRTISAWIGEPVALRESIAARFRRQSGSNLLIVTKDEEAALGMTAIALISVALQIPISDGSLPSIYVLDFSSTDTPYEDFFATLESYIPNKIKVGRRRQLNDTIAGLATEVQRRVDVETTGEAPKFLIIYGLQRARDLRPDDALSFSSEYKASSPEQQFTAILKDGPEVGIHTLIWCDTMTNLNRGIDRGVLREFAMRVVLQMSADDSSSLIDNTAATKLGPSRALLYDEDNGSLEKFRPYQVPSQEWLKEISVNLKTQ